MNNILERMVTLIAQDNYREALWIAAKVEIIILSTYYFILRPIFNVIWKSSKDSINRRVKLRRLRKDTKDMLRKFPDETVLDVALEVLHGVKIYKVDDIISFINTSNNENGILYQLIGAFVRESHQGDYKESSIYREF